MVTGTAVAAAPPDAQAAGQVLARRLRIAAVGCLFLAALDYLLLVRTRLGQRLDNASLAGAQLQSGHSRVIDALFLQHITTKSFGFVLVVLIAIGAVRRRIRLGIAVACAALVAVLATDGLKKWVLTRPQLVHDDIYRPDNTFPSGHTAIAIACAFALIVITPPALRGLAALVAGSYGWLVAADVQTAGWHRPSDAVGAAFIAFAVVALFSAEVTQRRPISAGRRVLHIPALILLGLVWLVGVMLGTLSAVRVLHFFADHADSLAPTRAVLNYAYDFCVDLTIVIVVTLVMTLLLLLGRSDLDAPLS